MLPKVADPITNILTLHGWGEIAKKENQKTSKIQVAKIARDNLKADCPPYLIPLMVDWNFDILMMTKKENILMNGF